MRRSPVLDLIALDFRKLTSLTHLLRILQGDAICLVICWTAH
jgi:hypothetical protein